MRPKFIFLSHVQNIMRGGKRTQQSILNTPSTPVKHGGSSIMLWGCFLFRKLFRKDGAIDGAKFRIILEENQLEVVKPSVVGVSLCYSRSKVLNIQPELLWGGLEQKKNKNPQIRMA